MSNKKVKRIAIGTAAVVVVIAVVFGVLAALGINLFSCSKNSGPTDAPETTVNISAAPPSDGSLPTAHTGIENISYMVYVLNRQESWHSYSETASDASINHQMTYTYKDYKDGVLIASDMTSSSFVKSSTQTAYIGDGAYTRTGSDPTSTDITDIVWNDGEPEYLERQSYYLKYGLFADEISVFLLNEDTVSSWGDVVDNGDGTYTQAFTLDTETAAYYYQYNMYTRGGLSAYPEFTAINLTFTFDADWQVLSVQTYEVASVRMGIISTTNTSESNITYTYGDNCIDEYNYSFYESYFKQYVGNVAEGNASADDEELSVTEVLQYGFGEVLSGGKQYAMDIVVGDTAYTGYIYASVDLDGLSVDTLGAIEIRLSLGKTADDQLLYAELVNGDIAVYYSDSFAVSANISELSLLIDQISAFIGSSDDGGTQTVALNAQSQSNITALAKTLTADGSSDDDDILTQLLSIIEITETENGATLAIKTDDLLGTGIGIDLTMDFAKDDESVLTFTNAAVNSISYGGEEISVSVTLSDTEAEVITRNEELTPVSLADFTASVYDLLSADLLEITLTMDGNNSSYSSLDGLSVTASALVDINSVIVGADLYVSYATESGSLSARLAAYYNYTASEYGDIYLYLYELDGKAVDVKLYCDIAELADTITVLLGGTEEDADETAEEISQTAAQIINSVLAMDISSVITKLYSYGSTICLGVDLDVILSLLGAEDLPKLGTAALIYDGESLSLALEALGLSIDVAKADGAVEAPDASEYINVNEFINEVYGLISSQTFNFTLTLDGENCGISELSGLSLSLDASFDAASLILASAVEVSYDYEGSILSAKLDIYYAYNEQNYGTIYVNIYELCGKAVDVRLCASVSDIDELTGGMLSGITESVDLSDEESLELAEILGALVAFDYNAAITVLSATSSEIKLGLDVDGILSRLGVDFSGVGAVELVYLNGALTASAENLGLSAKISGSDDGIALPEDTEEYLNISDIVTAVNGLINSDTVTAEISVNDSNISYLDGVSLDGTINYTIASGVLEVELAASYNTISVDLTAYCDGAAVYLYISDICGAETNVKVVCALEDLSAALESLLGDTGTEITVAADEILNTVLALDFGAIITELKVNASEGVYLGIDIDELLAGSGVDLGLSLGEITVSYNGGALELAAEYAGITASVCGNESVVTLPVDAEKYVDIIAAAKDIYSVIQSDIINIELSVDGGDLLGGLVDGGYLDGVLVSGVVSIALDGSAVLADLEVSYAYGGEGVSLGLQAYYDGEVVYLLIDGVNGAAASIGVSCTVETLSETLSQLLTLTAESGSGENSGESEQAAADIVTILLAMDYSLIIDELTVYDGAVILGVNVDEIIQQLAENGVISADLSGLTLGAIKLTYDCNGTLVLEVESVGAQVTVSGESGTLSKPEANYLSVESVIALVESVQAEIAGIEASKSVYFDIDCYVTADDLTLGLYGSGEVDWSGESATVALDLTMYIADGSSNPDEINLKLMYSAESVTIVVDKLGLTATAEDISGLSEGFASLLEAIYAMTGVSGSSLEASGAVSALSGVDASAELNSLLLNGDLPAILTALLGIVGSTDWVEELANFTLTVDGTGAALQYFDGCTITFTADGGLALVSTSASGNENYIKVTSGAGLYDSIESEIASGEYTIMTTADGAKLTEIMYNYGLGLISNASIANTLGTETYEISLTLDGNNTGVSELQGVTVEAVLYYTDTVTTTVGDGKLTEMDVNMNINGVTAVFNIIYHEESLYITLTNINNTELHDLKLTVALGDIYDIADRLVEVLLNTNLISYFGTASAASGETEEVTEETAVSISETLVKLLSIDFDSLIGCAKTVEDGSITRSVWVDIDEIYKAFAESENGVGLGVVTASIVTAADESGKTRRSVYVQGVYDGAVWLDIGAYRVTARDYSAFDTTEYWDLAFLKYLISDIVDFGTDDNGDIYEVYTFSGDLTASLDLSIASINIPIDVLNLTVGIDNGGNLYITLLGDLDTTTVLGMTVTEDWLFGFNIAYSSEYGGYIVTIANNLGTTEAQYQVMTLNYLTDNLLKSNSCLQFMLGTNSTLWSLICSGLSAGGISLDSGISTPDELYLTNSGYTLNSTTDEGDAEFDITKIITGINAYIGGESYSCGTTDVSYGKLSSQIGSSDYYAIDLDNDTIDEYTDGGITEVYAAILRDADGISGLVANGYIGGVMSFTLNLTYNEGIDEEFDLLSGEGTLVYEQTEAAESGFYAEVEEVSEGAGYYVVDENGNYVYTESYDGTETLYTFSNDTYYIKNGDGTYSLATEYDGTAVYYAANYSSDITSFYAPNLYNVVIANYGSELDYDRYSQSAGSTDTFGCFELTYDGAEWVGEYIDQTELYSFNLTVIYPDGTEKQFTLKYTSTIYAEAAGNTFENGDLYVYYIVGDDGSLTPMGSEYTFTGDTTLQVVLVGYQVTINGIIYTFDSSLDGYSASGVSGDGYDGSTLVLESEINGYEVKSVSAGAFGSAFVSGGAYGSVTTIVLPESITTIGGRSFYACTNLQNVVCLADTITLETDGTTSGFGSDHGYPFYDCSSTLTLYYTNLDSSVDSGKCFEYYESWFTYYPVNTVSSGWTYTGGEVSGCEDESLEEVIQSTLAGFSGINVAESIDDMQNAAQNAVDAWTLENYGYVGYYRVELSTAEEADGRYIIITATVKSGYGEYYLLEIISERGAVAVNADEGDAYIYNGATYVKAGASVSLTVTANGGNRFTGFSDITGYDGVIEQGEAFIMPACALSVTAYYETYFETLYITSAVAFTYDGTEYASGTAEISGEYTASSVLSTPEAEGYTFLGWAYDNDGTLTFADDVVITESYCAVWAVSEVSAEITAITSGTELGELSADGYTFQGWWVYYNGEWVEADDLSVCGADAVYEALWLGETSVTINSGSKSGSLLKGYTHTVNFTVNCELVGAFAEAASRANNISYQYKSWGSYSSGSPTVTDEGGNTYTATLSTNGASGKDGVKVTASVTYTYGGWSVTTSEATAEKTY